MDPEAHIELESFCSKFASLALGPKAKVEDHIYTEHQNSRRCLSQKQLDRPVPGVVRREVGAAVVYVHSEKPDMPLIDGKAERGAFDLELASQRRRAASRQSNHQVKCCHRPASPDSLYI